MDQHASADGPEVPATRPVVIGVAGGIGSGKSAVARAFADLGCVVLDSDAAARAALDRPEVRDELVGWWGDGVLGDDGRISRRAVADRVFGDPEARRRLETLIHPIVGDDRRRALARAAEDETPAVVIDAPLLFEAGVDRECDAVVFVEAARATRLDRVRRSRGWDEAELARRESAQMPLDEKRARSAHIIDNDGSDPSLLAVRAARVLDIVMQAGEQRRR